MPRRSLHTVVERPPDGHPIYSLIGLVASEWAHLERALDCVISRLSGIQRARSGCLTSQLMGVAPRFRSIVAFLTQEEESDPRFRKLKGKVNSLIQKSKSPTESRNRIVHDPWFVDKSDSGVAQFLSMPGSDLHYGVRKKDYSAIIKTVSEIRSLADEVKMLDRTLIVALEGSRRKQPSRRSPVRNRSAPKEAPPQRH